ncbi:MAG TPA: substrate-binding domain-containing protein [Phycisphaerales bacterium]|nr:substrate-binding domain-containing protein [Phycisphaerales bacterium]
MHMPSRRSCLATLTALALLCTPAFAQPAARKFTIGYSQCNRGEPWREQMDKDIEAQCLRQSQKQGREAADAAGQTPVKLDLQMKDAQNEASRQMAHVKEFINARVDLIIISPKDDSLTPAIAEAFDAGIPIIILDRAVKGEKYTTFIGADNRLIGAQVGKWVVEKLKGKGNVVELKGLTSSQPSADRSEPFRKALDGTSIKIVYDADMEWLSDIAREKMQAALSRNPRKGSINLVYGANDPAAIAAYNAARDAGREKEMIFVGVDALPHEGIEAVRKGILHATFEYPNGADRAVESAVKILTGKGSEVPRKIILGTRLYTKENVDSGGEEIKP